MDVRDHERIVWYDLLRLAQSFDTLLHLVTVLITNYTN